jgi:phosphoenolpyruvate-protein kinase (PTS system EI component)
MRLLPRAEAELFEPEVLILDELDATLSERLAGGMQAEDVVEASTTEVAMDLMIDARARILDAMAHSHRSVEEHLEGSKGDVVLVAEKLTPSIVASLPARVVGIVSGFVAGGQEESLSTAHSEILAREREIPLALVNGASLSAIKEADLLVVDAREDDAIVSIAPKGRAAREAWVSRRAWLHARAEMDAEVAEPLRQLDVGVLINVGSLRERVPASAEGIGLVRTELVFSDHLRAPSEAEQFGVVCAIASLCPRATATVRLFDAGDDKPLPWLAPPSGAESARGIALLRHHPDVLAVQLRALERAGEHVQLRILVPYAQTPADVVSVRAKTNGRLEVGALIETAEAVARIDDIVSVSDFVSIGTNDLAASVTGDERANAGLSLDVRLLAAIERIVLACAARALPVTVCGELAGDPHGARVMIGLGVRAISVAPLRIAAVKRSLRSASMDECRAIARAAMGGPGSARSTASAS